MAQAAGEVEVGMSRAEGLVFGVGGLGFRVQIPCGLGVACLSAYGFDSDGLELKV